jgi:hypothetical protein
MMSGSCWGPKRGLGFGTTVAAAVAAAAETAAVAAAAETAAATRSRSPMGAAMALTLDSAATASGASQRERMEPASDAGGVAPETAPSRSSEIVCSNGVNPRSLMTRLDP